MNRHEKAIGIIGLRLNEINRDIEDAEWVIENQPEHAADRDYHGTLEYYLEVKESLECSIKLLEGDQNP